MPASLDWPETDPAFDVFIEIIQNRYCVRSQQDKNHQWIIREPYIPVVNSPGSVKAHALGLRVNPQARAWIFPNIGSYFGGDLIAGILFSEIHKKSGTCIIRNPDRVGWYCT